MDLTITYGTKPATTPLTLSTGTSPTYNNAADSQAGNGVTVTGTTEGYTAASSWGGEGGNAILNTSAEFTSGTAKPGAKVYYGAVLPQNGAFSTLNFYNATTRLTVQDGGGTLPAGWELSINPGNNADVGIDITSAPDTSTVAWFYVTGSDLTRVTQFSTGGTSTIGSQAVVFDTAEPPNCFPEGTQLILASGDRVPIQELKQGDAVAGVAPDGSPRAIRVNIVKRFHPAAKGYVIDGSITTSSSHFLLTDEKQTKAGALCFLCGQALHERRDKGCDACCPVVVAGYYGAQARFFRGTATELLHDTHWYHLVPDETGFGCAFKLTDKCLSEFYRTPLDRILETTQWKLAE